MSRVLSVNIARPLFVDYSHPGVTGIDKRPTDSPVAVSAPGPRGTGGSGLAGDEVCDRRFHGGDHQAVYAYGREDLDGWEAELGRPLADGAFGENLTTGGIDVNATLIGERWRVGRQLLLEATSPRIPCRTFACWLGEEGWVQRFRLAALPGCYFRVIEPGTIGAGDRVEVVHRPDHAVTAAVLFRAMTLEPELLPATLAAGDALNPSHAGSIRARLAGRHGAAV